MTATGPARQKRSTAQTRAGEYAVLGLLAAEAAPTHGYVLMQHLSDGALAEIIRIEPGMLYHHLKSLAKREWITTEVERQASRPDRQLHAITPDGREALAAWIAEPVRATRELRLEFLVKLYLAQIAGAESVRPLVASQREVIASLVASLREQRDGLDPAATDLAFRRHILDLRLAQNHAALTWLDSLQSV